MTQTKPEKIFQGNAVSSGIVLGRALKLDSHNRILLKVKLPDAASVEAELDRFQKALKNSQEQLVALKSHFEEKVGNEHSFILDAHLLMLEDQSLNNEIQNLIRCQRGNAEWAVRKATEKLIRAYGSLADPYFRERSSDIENVVERLLQNLTGDRPVQWEDLPEDLIVVSHDFNPSSFAVIDLSKIKGLALENGGRTSHTAIIARSLSIPSVMKVENLLSAISSGDLLLLDGDDGRIVVHPSEASLKKAHHRMQEFKARKEPSFQQEPGSALTQDGVAIATKANTELPHEGRLAREYGAEGVGLFRSEYLYFSHPDMVPSLEDHLHCYRALVKELCPFPVAIRTLDLGGDEIGCAKGTESSTNPSMGLRGIRLSLLYPQAFATQIEAILRAGADGKIEIVLPMISSIEEIREAKAVIKRIETDLCERRERFSASIPLGVMIEVPAAVLALEIIAPEVDFLCVGTNDLIQYTLAVDRNNAQVAHLYQPLHPSILKCLNNISSVSKRLKKPVRVCGEISANPFFAVLLVGMGFNQLSMNAVAIPAIRKILSKVNARSAAALVEKIMMLPTASEIAECLIPEVSKMVGENLTSYEKEIRTSMSSGIQNQPVQKS